MGAGALGGACRRVREMSLKSHPATAAEPQASLCSFLSPSLSLLLINLTSLQLSLPPYSLSGPPSLTSECMMASLSPAVTSTPASSSFHQDARSFQHTHHIPLSSLPPLPKLEPSPVTAQRAAVASQSSPSVNPHPLGTADNPLIPKRRRRTSPQEAQLLEQEFKRNALPSQAERNRIADRVGMTGRVSAPSHAKAGEARPVGSADRLSFSLSFLL